jgi:predicted nucleic acid-binding protein
MKAAVKDANILIDLAEADLLGLWFKLDIEMHVSLPDASAYQLAQTLGAILLSGDRTLRNAATKSGVEVRGVLWVLDSLVQKKLLPAVEAAARLHRLMTGQSFLPPVECAKRLGRWEGKDSR